MGFFLEEQYIGKKELELYFHIPFCVRKCDYCDFLSAPGDEETKELYMEALLAETVGSAFRYTEYQVASIFIGGGTPSVVPVSCMERLMAAVRAHYCLAEDAEVTIEVNPGTVSGEMLARFYRAGINRLSIGLQSADDKELKAIGRIHTWQQFADCFAAAREAGFDNINVDVMSALPGQTLSGYVDTLRKVLSLGSPPEHISAYSLILEEGTPLYDRYENGALELPDEDTDREMYQETKAILAQAGYERYEISNYAKKGYECRHNCGYWQRKDYVGFGIGAASLVENVRFRNGADLRAYLENPLGCREDVQDLSRQEQMEECMFLGLRMTGGVSCAKFAALFGCSLEEVYGDVIRKNVDDGLLQYLHGTGAYREECQCAGKCQIAKGCWCKEKSICAEECQYIGDCQSNGDSQDKEMEQRMDGQFVGTQYREDGTRLALTDRGLDVSNYVMAQFLL